MDLSESGGGEIEAEVFVVVVVVVVVVDVDVDVVEICVGGLVLSERDEGEGII